ncbi:MAG: hypothetical protein V1746_07880 [bacterium]
MADQRTWGQVAWDTAKGILGGGFVAGPMGAVAVAGGMALLNREQQKTAGELWWDAASGFKWNPAKAAESVMKTLNQHLKGGIAWFVEMFNEVVKFLDETVARPPKEDVVGSVQALGATLREGLVASP